MWPEEPELRPVHTSVDTDQWLTIIDTVIQSGVDNKDKWKIPVNTKWNFDLFSQLLVDYVDREIVHPVRQYGWPIKRDGDTP